MTGVEHLVHGGEPTDKDAKSCIYMRSSHECDQEGKLWEAQEA
jgi:hypothetical protein